MAVEQFDVAIIGAGQAGGPLGSAFGNAGRKTIVIERIHVGGTCVNEGCTPTKTMIASGDVAYRARRGADFGVETGEITISMEKIRERKRSNVRTWREGSEKSLIYTPNLELLMGEASFTGPKTIRVAANDGTVREIAAETIVINAGERPAPPRVEGADRVPYLTSTTIMELAIVPEHLVVIGGGYIGLEFAQLFRRLGSEVTIVQHGNQLLSREDPDIAEALHDILVDDGLTIYLNAQTKHVSGSEGAIDLTIEVDGKSIDIRGTHLLSAAGRIPNSDSLALDKAGIETDARGYIVTDDRLETNVPGVYAVGDIRPGPKFTHISYDDYRILQANLIDGGERSVLDRQEPYTVFTEPQLGRIGLSEEDAKRQGVTFKVATMPMSSVARAFEVDEPEGFMKVLVDPETEQILGAAILGINGGEIMAMLQIAMMGELPYTRLRDAVWAHPTLAEGLNNLFFSFRE
jgi:pyruvate/2-oxoglutarate dehydrogenase complex dihydrolipoamide dehydrogenase (E3) component